MLSYNLPLSYADKTYFPAASLYLGDGFRGVTTLSFIEIESSLKILKIGDVVFTKFIAYLSLQDVADQRDIFKYILGEEIAETYAK